MSTLQLVPTEKVQTIEQKLDEILGLLQSQKQPNELMSAPEAAKFLGVTEQYVRLHKQKIGYTKIGSNIRFYRNDLEEFAAQNREDRIC